MYYVTPTYLVRHTDSIWLMPIAAIYCNESKEACERWVKSKSGAFTGSATNRGVKSDN